MSSNLSNEFNDFSQFVQQELAAGEELSLEQCLERWRESQSTSAKTADKNPTPFELASQLGLIGCIPQGPHDLASNPRHMETFGES